MTTVGSGLFESKSPGPRRNGKGGNGALEPIQIGRLFEKPPPQAAMAEMALLGAMLLDPKIIHEVIPVIRTPEVFFQPAHAAIYSALVKVYDQKQAVNMVLLAEELQHKEILDTVGGPDYLLKLAEDTPGPATAVHFARIVIAKAKLRKLIETGGQMIYDAYHASDLGPEGVREIIDRAEKSIFDIAESEESGEAEHLANLVEKELERLESLQGKGLSGVPTHFTDFDRLTSGLQEGEMTILAARPSMGKTALALNMAEQVALGGAPNQLKEGRRGVPVGIFSMEMSKASIAQRILSSRSGLSSHDMRSGRLKSDQYELLHDVLEELRSAPIYVDDTPGLTVLGLRTRARRMVSQYGVRCIFIDYLQLMSSPSAAKESRQVEVSSISRGVKALARELSIPIVCLSQLNRGPESRGDNRPRMSDLRESGSIEQDADVVVLIHREAYYHVGDHDWEADNPDKLNKTELIIAKQRNGPTDSVELVWDASTTRFKDSAYAGSSGGGRRGAPAYASESADAAFGPPPTGGGKSFGGAGGGGTGAGSGGAGGGGGGWSGDPFRVPVQSFSPSPSAPKNAPSSSSSGGGGGDPFADPFSGGGTLADQSGGGSRGGGYAPGSAFQPSKKTGPVSNFRDGGGPINDDDAPSRSEEAPPFDMEDEGDLPV